MSDSSTPKGIVTPKDLDITLHDRVPDGQWEIVDVVFPATAQTDFQIPHSLSPASPEQLEYTVLRQATPGTVYEDRSATRTPWGPGFIILRSDTASWTGRILLRVLKSSLLWTPGQNIVYTPPASGPALPLTLENGGTEADLSATGPGYLKQASAGAVITVATSIAAGDIGSGTLALARGGTNADLSATGGAGQVLKQKTSGGDIAVEALAAGELGSGTGSSSNFLRGDLAWAVPAVPTQPYTRVYKSADQTGFTVNVYSVLSWNSEDSDVPGWHDNSTNNSRITLDADSSYTGTYLVLAGIEMRDVVAGGGGWAYVTLRKNAAGSSTGGTQLFEHMLYGPNGAVYSFRSHAWIGTLTAGDYVELFAKCSQAGGTLTVFGGSTRSYFAVIKLY